MPRVKIDYIVSFSNEDPENQASNLLSWEVSKKRWLCSKGEPSCSVVLQLAKAVKVSSVQIGAHHSALVEVLVGRSETPNEPFQVLVPSSVFLSPKESRGDSGLDKVRSFDSGALAAAVCAQRWDRVRIVCSQPYNKHCKYGISFIHIFESEGAAPPPAPRPAPTSAVPPRLFGLDTFSSDEEEFSPGELFAKHRLSGATASTDTGAQIRQATSQALKNKPDAATKLMKAPLSKNKPPSGASPSVSEPRDRQRDKHNLMYTDDDDQPHNKIDHIVQRHKDEKRKDEDKAKPKEKVDSTPRRKDDDKDKKNDKNSRSMREEHSTSRSESKRDGDTRSTDSKRDDRVRETDRSEALSRKNEDGKNNERRKRRNSDRNRTNNASSSSSRGQSASEREEKPLRGVVFVMSGYQNPRRARLRDLALSLGAACQRDWGPRATHLICAFSNTPKLKSIRAAPGGGGVPAARGEWLEECGRKGRLLPWQWFATEDRHRQQPPPSPPPSPRPSHSHTEESECDTDDEIEKVLQHQKKRARVSPPSSPTPSRVPAPAPAPDRRTGGQDSESEVEFVKDERMQGNITVEDSESEGADTEPEEVAAEATEDRISPSRGSLPALFSGLRFVVGPAGALDSRLLARYCTAYGGLVLTPDEVNEDTGPHIVLCGAEAGPGDGGDAGGRGRRVRGEWVWASHAAQAALPLDSYLCS